MNTLSKPGWGMPQEALKLIACITMLIDHMGAVLFPWNINMRIIGRIAFPIYCFLLAEGAHYTRNPRGYALRLGIGMLLSELPFDLAFERGWTWHSQSVMVTLLMGFCAIEGMKHVKSRWLRPLIGGGACLLAEFACTDYGGFGVAMIICFSGFRENIWLQTALLALICWLMGSFPIRFCGILVPIEMFAVLAMVPIALYSGRKATHSKAVQWIFYLFYPVHLAILCLIRERSAILALIQSLM